MLSIRRKHAAPAGILVTFALLALACSKGKGTETSSTTTTSAPTVTAAPVGAAATAGGAPGTTNDQATAASVIPEMTQFLGELDGTSKKVGAALKKHGTKGLKTDDMQLWNLASPAITASSAHGKLSCYTMDAASGATTRTYELCWVGGKIVSVKDDGMK